MKISDFMTVMLGLALAFQIAGFPFFALLMTEWLRPRFLSAERIVRGILYTLWTLCGICFCTFGLAMASMFLTCGIHPRC